MKLKIFGALAAMALLAACSTTPKAEGTGGGGGGMVNTGPTGPTGGSEEDLVRNVGDRVFYELNSSTLSDSAQDTLGKQAAWLAKYPSVTVQIAGNCDDRGTEEFNLALGNRRAKAAKDFWWPRASPPAASPPSATAKTARPRWATMTKPGHRTVTPSPP